jgi:hypothetical protein
MIADNKIKECNCHQPCNEIGYEVSYSAARWPSGTAKLLECEVHDDLCMEKYRKNAAMIQVRSFFQVCKKLVIFRLYLFGLINNIQS